MNVVIGCDGFIGSNLCKDLNCVGISKENYNENIGNYDVIINANGNSSKILPEHDPILGFDLNVRNTLKTVVDFKFDTYIYLSSCEVYGNGETSEDVIINIPSLSRYALSKYLAECVVKNYCKRWIILRLNGVIGPNLKKGAIFDILHGDKLWISDESQFQLIHTKYISELVTLLINKGIANEIINVTGIDSIMLKNLNYREIECPECPTFIHQFNVNKANSFLKIPSSIESFNRLKNEKA